MAPKISITNDLRIDQLEEEQSEALKKALTLANPAHVAAVQQGRSTWGIPPTLQFFRQEGGALVVPRGFASELPRFGSFGLDDQRLALPEEPFVFSGLLREYQNAAVQAVLKRAQGALQAGTGAGKTVMALAAARPEVAFTDAGDQNGTALNGNFTEKNWGLETKLFRPDPLAD